MIRSLLRSLGRRLHLLSVLALLGVLALSSLIGGHPVAADPWWNEAGQAPAIPRLTDVSPFTQTPALFTVTGIDFTVGGRVYLAVYDQMGAKLFETRWVTATLTTTTRHHEPGDGLLPPTAVTTPGGDVREAFAGLCGATAMIRAHDETTAIWSNWLPIQFACDSSDRPRMGQPY
jgi:hypothetical protein